MRIAAFTAASLLTLALLAPHAARAETPATAPATTLTVTFTVTDAPTGQIMLSLYDNQAAHDGGGKPVAQAAVPVVAGKAVARFAGLVPGAYAIKAFHDVDGDGKMGTNPFGMPVEPFAFSNNAPPQGGPAKWAAASFAVAGADAATSISIR
ncbi:MAG: DUF2141 domain-containing protein [Sphingomonadales bacterium]|jgi:uncharacterized protein (DUF2141 family)